MAVYYIDLDNGNDSNNGSSWALAWKTITNGATAARIAPGDEIRVSKTPDPVSIGNASWTDNTNVGGGFPATQNIASSTNASPIVITKNTHGYNNGDVIQVIGHTSNAGANGAWVIANVSTNTFELVGSTGTGTGGANGTIQKINSKAVVLETAQTQTINRTNVAWTAAAGSDTTVALVAAATEGKEGGGAMRFTLDATPQANILQAYRATGSLNLSSYQKISFWIKNSAAITTPTVTAGSFLVGVAYTILTIGSTDFTLIGASANTIGVTFVATGVGVGTGTATGCQWMVALCSDTAGATPVDKFIIPAIPSTARYLPLTITKAGGGNLGSLIQSISIRTGSAPANSSNILISNVFASTTSGLCLQCLIGKNGAAQGGTNGYYGIQSISETGKVILLDNDTNTYANVGRGYSGTTETVTSYMRGTYKTALAATSTTAVSTINDSGTLGNLISYRFGYEVGTTNQNGETFLDGLNGNGYGISLGTTSYNSLDFVNLYRYYNGIYGTNPSYVTIPTISNASNNTNNGISVINFLTATTISNVNNNSSQGFQVGKSSSLGTISNVNNNLNSGLNIVSNTSSVNTTSSVNNNGSYGINFSNGNNNIFNQIGNVNGNVTYGFNFSTSSNNTILSIQSVSNNTTTSIAFATGSGNNKIYNSVTAGGTNGVESYALNNYLCNSTINQSSECLSDATNGTGFLWSLNHDNTTGNHWGFTYQATVNLQVSTVHLSEPCAWKTAITGSTRISTYPVKLKIAEVAFTASSLVTVKAWVKKDHATNVGCKLATYTNTSVGINSDVAVTKANDTDWEELTITFTPTQSGVTEIYLESWYSAGNSNTYVGSITVSQI